MVAPGSPASSKAPPRRRNLPVWADIPSFTAFAQEIEQALDGPELRYSDRLHLLDRASHFGISRFDANLIIAMVQNRMGIDEVPLQLPGQRHLSAFTLIAAGITQFIIIVAIWWLMR